LALNSEWSAFVRRCIQKPEPDGCSNQKNKN
jgi:hypothetical protein